MKRRLFIQTITAASLGQTTTVASQSNQAAATPYQYCPEDAPEVLGYDSFRCGPDDYMGKTMLLKAYPNVANDSNENYRVLYVVLTRWSYKKELKHKAIVSPVFDFTNYNQRKLCSRCLADQVRHEVICATDPHFKKQYIVDERGFCVPNPDWPTKYPPCIVPDWSIIDIKFPQYRGKKHFPLVGR